MNADRKVHYLSTISATFSPNYAPYPTLFLCSIVLWYGEIHTPTWWWIGMKISLIQMNYRKIQRVTDP
jgi:hypothetical protein